IACMALADLRMHQQWEGFPPGSTVMAPDAALERYARSDAAGNITIRRLADDREILRLPGPGKPAWTLLFSPNDRFLAAKYHPRTQSQPNRLLVWDLSRRSVAFEVPPGISELAVAFSPDNRRMAAGHPDGSIGVYDLASGRQVRSMTPGPVPVCL